ncbi:uncharacterized protein P174DRAFT_440746 [Aspergillus novofumigatus IBT 16806]|uniref:Uncharacterized protein n=1 Tax=Aspergillus novofumigatus (strain IBT 16806) TaxID=1392255 RepID=A0A2I1CEW5_ASPN1|nr:uncharacterized protein P174DRAFT_440746 [Aspergillus novofumigatus IBT 16806]PKX96152.1 hypothetical protein P174DRAFT_440746 [Aspergillus novofumigatus IBT 16806]
MDARVFDLESRPAEELTPGVMWIFGLIVAHVLTWRFRGLEERTRYPTRPKSARMGLSVKPLRR